MNNKFLTGSMVATASVNRFLKLNTTYHIWVDQCIERHKLGDWGDLDHEDKEANDQALENGDRLFSSYERDTVKIWIITEADRSYTTILFPHEY